MSTVPASLPTAFAVFSLIAAPSLVTVGIANVTDNPSLRPMGLTEERVAAADVEIGEPHVRVRIYWTGPADSFRSAPELAEAIRSVFATKGVETRIAIFDDRAMVQTMLDMRAGSAEFGPFPVSEAARHVEPAVQAVRFARQERLGPDFYLWQD